MQIEAQGPEAALRAFLQALERAPPPGRVERVDTRELSLVEERGFEICDSEREGEPRPALPADLAVCDACAAEAEQPGGRRYGYPFTNCARCGPRYAIVEALPYDRANTSMRAFSLCAACSAEYADGGDRRFHAQPIACPACGPTLALQTPDGLQRAEGRQALGQAAKGLQGGEVLALKGLGGFQLLVDATSEAAVAALRARKRRAEKPFAVLLPSLEAARALCVLTREEERALTAPEAPILLVRKRCDVADPIAPGVAPGHPRLGVMLPYTPLHRLLIAAAGRPLVCTSGNLSEEPMCIDEVDARQRLAGIADMFLVHDRPIVRPIDDSVARVDGAGLQVLRRARGFAPLPLPIRSRRCVLATGGQLKSTLALATRGAAIVSQHLGDLRSLEGASLLERTARDLVRFFDAAPELVACDLHPDYASTRLAERLASAWRVPIERVQHHHAHVAACMAEHGLSGPVLGLAWDGAGLGTDGILWGGEALLASELDFRRIAHLRPFALPGGEAAVREPARAALGLLYELSGERAGEHIAMDETRLRPLLSMLHRQVNCPRTSSMGRLFDGVAALIGVRARSGYEGQAAMELEFAAEGVVEASAYSIPLTHGEPAVADWEPLLRAVLRDRARGVPASAISARFHNALAALAESMAALAGVPRVVLSGGCFQNVRLLAALRERLSARGFQVFTPRSYPPNDGGLSLGQLYVAACRKEAGHVPRHPG